jgi:hypothetical protein
MRILLILSLILLCCKTVISQNVADTLHPVKPLFGFNAGLLGLFIIDETQSNSNTNNNQITTPVVSLSPGFHAGAHISFINSERFALLFGLNISFLSRRYVYQCFSENRWGSKQN